MFQDELCLEQDIVEYKGGTLCFHDYVLQDFENRNSATNGNIHSQVPWAGEDPTSFFCGRDGLVMKAIEEIKLSVLATCDNEEVVGSWLLTEITFWDNEKERVVLLTKNYLIIAKYDFIALKFLDHYKVALRDIDTLAIGDVVYPTGSLAPPRNMIGIRPMWNKGQPIKFSTKWNPFTNSIPWDTFVSHPLLWHKDEDEEELRMYNVENFISRLIKVVQQTERESICNVHHQPILLHNYFGFLSVLHNRNALGFFKVRGKFSF